MQYSSWLFENQQLIPQQPKPKFTQRKATSPLEPELFNITAFEQHLNGIETFKQDDTQPAVLDNINNRLLQMEDISNNQLSPLKNCIAHNDPLKTPEKSNQIKLTSIKKLLSNCSQPGSAKSVESQDFRPEIGLKRRLFDVANVNSPVATCQSEKSHTTIKRKNLEPIGKQPKNMSVRDSPLKYRGTTKKQRKFSLPLFSNDVFVEFLDGAIADKKKTFEWSKSRFLNQIKASMQDYARQE